MPRDNRLESSSGLQFLKDTFPMTDNGQLPDAFGILSIIVVRLNTKDSPAQI